MNRYARPSDRLLRGPVLQALPHTSSSDGVYTRGLYTRGLLLDGFNIVQIIYCW